MMMLCLCQVFFQSEALHSCGFTFPWMKFLDLQVLLFFINQLGSVATFDDLRIGSEHILLFSNNPFLVRFDSLCIAVTI